MIKSVLAAIGLAVVLYVSFFIPLGERTLAQHVQRIWATDEAQELSRDIETAADDLETHLQERLRDGSTDADAGPSAPAPL